MDVFINTVRDLFSDETVAGFGSIKEFFAKLAADFREAFEFVVNMFNF